MRGRKLWVFLILVGSMILNMYMQPYYDTADGQLEAVALTALLLVLYAANSRESLDELWVQWLILACLLVVFLCFYFTKTKLTGRFLVDGIL
eukprot:SAG31_NODE_439_length_15675_cov_6.578390_15_plen_92_part_00